MFHPSAFKHGLSDADIEHAWVTGEAHQSIPEDDEPARTLRIGTDPAGRPVELVALIFDQERVLIIPAMYARKTTLTATERRRR